MMLAGGCPGPRGVPDYLATDEALARSLAAIEETSRDAELARSLAEQEDAAVARRLNASSLPTFGSAPGWPQPAASARQCPRAHPLQHCVPRPGVGHTCDRCGRSVKAPSTIWRCSTCNYDLCEACGGQAPRPQQPFPPAPAVLGQGPPVRPASSFASGAAGAASAGTEGEDRGMIYVPCEIGSITVEMMVDTGAQMSVISAPLAKRFGLMTKLDSRHQGMATGVGSARIMGKLRGVQVKLGLVEFALDFSVLGLDEPLLMLGLDQMRRFKCICDLEKDCLRFGGRDGVEVAFLPSATRSAADTLRCPTMYCEQPTGTLGLSNKVRE